MYELIIIGGGPAATAAGVYTARKKIKSALFTDEFGGQSKVSTDIQNWIGTVSISGEELSENLKKHLKAYANDSLEIHEGDGISKINKVENGFEIKTNNGEKYQAKTIFIATGSHRRKLNVPGAEEFENKGLTYCATCDGPLFAGKDVVVVGGGNAGFETASQLLAYTKTVTLLNRGDSFKAVPLTVEKVLSNPKMKAITNVDVVEIKGDAMVSSITYKDIKTGETTELPTGGIFVEIGQIPTTSLVKDLVDLNDYNQIEIDPWTQKTSIEGIWAAGDCTNVRYHQNNIAVGDAIKATEDIYAHLRVK